MAGNSKTKKRQARSVPLGKSNLSICNGAAFPRHAATADKAHSSEDITPAGSAAGGQLPEWAEAAQEAEAVPSLKFLVRHKRTEHPRQASICTNPAGHWFDLIQGRPHTCGTHSRFCHGEGCRIGQLKQKEEGSRKQVKGKRTCARSSTYEMGGALKSMPEDVVLEGGRFECLGCVLWPMFLVSLSTA